MNSIVLEESPIRLPEVLRLTSVSRSWVYAQIKLGNFPPPAYRYGRSVAWCRHAIMKWLASKRI